MKDQEKIQITIQGIRPLIMHNGRTADPLDPWAVKLKSLTGSRGKTEDNYQEIADVEMQAFTYCDRDIELGEKLTGGRVYIPCDNLMRMFLDAAKKIKQGRNAVAIMVEETCIYLEVPGWKSLEDFFTNDAFRFRKCVNNSGRTVARCRPKIPTGWRASMTVDLDTTLMDVPTFLQILEIAGSRIGLGDWRPGAPKVPGTFGRFVVETVNGKAFYDEQ